MVASAKRYPLLTAQQEVLYSRQIREWLDTEQPTRLQVRRGQRAKERMMQSNLLLVAALAQKFRPRIAGTSLDCEDLFQAGAVGLNRAAEKFDYAKGYKFSTYGYWWITQGIQKEIERHRSTIRTGHEAQTIARRWRYKPEDQTLEEFSEQYKYKPQKVKEILDFVDRAHCASLDKHVHDGDRQNSSLCELLAADNGDPFEEMQYQEGLGMLESIPELNDALALISLSQQAAPKEIGALLDISTVAAQKKVKDAKAVVREHAPESVRELICGAEQKVPFVALESNEQTPVEQPKPKQVLVAAGNHEPLPMIETAAPVMNNHHQEGVEQLEKLVSEIQAEPEVKPKRRRGRRSKAEIEAAATAAPVAPVKPQTGIAVKVNGMDLEGQATDIAALLKAMQV